MIFLLHQLDGGIEMVDSNLIKVSRIWPNKPNKKWDRSGSHDCVRMGVTLENLPSLLMEKEL
jgi:hypothetical protein